ncbi:hypothetical protein, variant [Verruconis gallopava]|nr:hypothetical protein, variant [Verruconis gallopava]KIW07968.1 hypothetical protein, variant [Verruconis gallopava]
MKSSTSRKGQTSITHLMNFSLPPRPHHHYQHSHSHRSYRRNPTWGLGSGYHAVDKARYVHANYRFIVDPRGDYHSQSVDPDVYPDWSNVLQILASSQSQVASCPICLGEPTAPRMARCGHIFCLPCLIRFMHADDESKRIPEKKARSKRCPICEDTIYMSETRPVRMYQGQEGLPPMEGGDVVLRLVKRDAGSTLALPRDGATSLRKDEDIPWYFAAEVMDFAHIMKGTEDYMLSQLDNDIEAVKLQEQEDALMFPDDTSEWSRRAVRMLEEAKEKVKGIGGPVAAVQPPAETVRERAPIEFHPESSAPAMYNIQHASGSGQSVSEISSVQTSPPTSIASAEQSDVQRKQLAPPQPRLSGHQHGHSGNQAPPVYYYYQALLHYYLSPLDIRILREAFGHFSCFPATILPRVERVSTGHVVDDELRKRTKYLAHLPYGCEVNFLECDWTDTVAPEVLEKFRPEIERRRKRNEEKEAREEKARLNAEKEEEKRYAHLRRRRPDSVTHAWTEEDFQPLGRSEAIEGDVAAVTGGTGASPPWATSRQGSAFASLASISTSPNTARTVWGTAAVPPSSPPLYAEAEREPVDDGWLQGWEKDLLQEEDIVAQVQALSLGESSKSGAASRNASGGGGGKKKKKQKITLMSTTTRRGA